MAHTAVAHPNIALIKYWGKADHTLNIPLNPSISWTLDTVSTTTTVILDPDLNRDRLKLNGVRHEEQDAELERVSAFLDLVRNRAPREVCDLKATIISENNFPTSSGIASSASGFAALALAASKAYALELDEQGLSALSRQGSGSASRSISGGFVRWDGTAADQLFPAEHWPEFRDIILIVDAREKSVGSREAMRLTQEKSASFPARLESLPGRLDRVGTAIKNRDFPALAAEIMADSDNMHACIEEAGISYLNDASHEIKQRIREINGGGGGIIAAYTFDAGANAHIITRKGHVEHILEELHGIYRRAIVCKAGQRARTSEEHLAW